MKKRFYSQGMTLIEVMISIAILSILSITTSRMLLQAYKDQSKIEKKIEIESYIESIRNLIMRDISKAFHHRDINVQVYNSVQREKKEDFKTKAGNAEKNNQPEEARKFNKKANEVFIRSIKRLTQFIGSKDSLYFTSTHHERTVKDSPVSHLVELGYFVKGCKGRISNKEFKSCLWRSVSRVLDDDLKKGGEERVLLEDVRKVQFSYHQGGSSMDQESSWREIWRSDYLGRSELRGKFPRVVKVFLEFPDPISKKKDKIHSLGFMVPIAFPNNKKVEVKKN